LHGKAVPDAHMDQATLVQLFLWTAALSSGHKLQ